MQRVVRGLNEEGKEVNLERNEWRGFNTVEEAQDFGTKRLTDKGIQEEIDVLESERSE